MHTVNTLGCAASWRQFPGELPMKRLVMILVKERPPFGGVAVDSEPQAQLPSSPVPSHTPHLYFLT